MKKKKMKILMAVAVILAVTGAVQLYMINRSAKPMMSPVEFKVSGERVALSLKKVQIDHRLETLRDRMKSAPNKAETSRELELVTNERNALMKEIEEMKAKELKDAQLEAKKEKRESIKMYLTFLGSVIAAVSGIIVAIINKKKD